MSSTVAESHSRSTSSSSALRRCRGGRTEGEPVSKPRDSITPAAHGAARALNETSIDGERATPYFRPCGLDSTHRDAGLAFRAGTGSTPPVPAALGSFAVDGGEAGEIPVPRRQTGPCVREGVRDARAAADG